MQLRNNSALQNGKYRIIRVLGQGGFGITYLAVHTMLDKMVAIKEFFPKEYCDRNMDTSHLTIGTKNSVEIVEKLKGKFIKEAKNISKLRHPNIITIHDIFQENCTAYYVMEYVEGASLSQIIKEQGPISEIKAVGYIRKVADAVGYMHSLSMNHLDLKPANIMVRESDGEPILIDFGLSKQYDSSGGQTSTTPVGISHGFAPIEQYRPGGVASFTPQTDIYALGATLLNLISGNVPPHYSEILEGGLPELPSAVSKQCIAAIGHAMEIKKNKRPGSVGEFISELTKETHPDIDLDVDGHRKIEIKDYIQSNDVRASAEDTVLMDVIAKNVVSDNVIIDQIEFVDLGLSVRWADRNIGAMGIEDAGTCFAKSIDLNEIYQYNTQGAIVPQLKLFEELIIKCNWYWYSVNGSMGYTVVGPNGNSIRLPVTGDTDNLRASIVTFGLLWTNEALLNHWRSGGCLFYYNNVSYKLTNYITNIICPVRLVLR